MPNISNVTLNVTANLTAAERQIRQLESKGITLDFRSAQPLGRLSGDVAEFEKSMSAANARVIAFGASAGIISGVTIALRGMITESIAVDKALVSINATVGLTASQLKSFGDTLFAIAKNTGSSFSEVAKQAEQFSHSGLQMSEILHRTSDAMVLARISGLDAATAFKELNAEVNAFAREGLTTTQIVDRLAAVSSRFGVSAKDLSAAVSGIGEAAGNAKVPFNELIALVTRVQQTTSKGGAEIGVALKTIFSRIERKDTLDSLDQLGVAVRSINGDTLPAVEILSRLTQTYDRLGDAQKEQVAELIGGVRQVAVLKTALNDLNSSYSVFRNVVSAANDSAGAAASRNELLNKSIANLTNTASVNFTKLASAGGSAVFGPSIKKVLGQFNDGADSLNGEGIGQTIGGAILKGIGNALSGPGLIAGAFLAAKLLGSFASFATKAAGNVLEIGKASEKQIAVQQGVNALLQQSPALYGNILKSARSVTEQEHLFLAAIKERIAVQSSAKNFSSTISNSLAEKGVSFENGSFSLPKSITNQRKGIVQKSSLLEASGHVPNFVSEVAQMAEISAAARSGYTVQPNQVRSMNAKIDGRQTSVIYNTREKVISNFANTGEPAIIPPNKSLEGMINEKFHYAKGHIPNFAEAVDLNFNKSFAVVSLDEERETAFSFKTLLAELARTTYRKTKNNEGNILGIHGLTSEKLNQIHFKANAKTNSFVNFSERIQAGSAPKKMIQANDFFNQKLENAYLKSNADYPAGYFVRNQEDRIKILKTLVPNKDQGFFLEEAVGEVYGLPGFQFNNARFDLRSGISKNPKSKENLQSLLKDFELPQQAVNVDLKRTSGIDRVSASFATKAFIGSYKAEGEFAKVLNQIDTIDIAAEEREKFKTLLRDQVTKGRHNEFQRLNGNFKKPRPSYFEHLVPHTGNEEETLASRAKTFRNNFSDGFVPNLALSKETIERTRAVYNALKPLRGTPQLPDFVLRQLLNVSAEGGLRFGVPASAFQSGKIQTGNSVHSLPLRFTQNAQVGGLYAPEAYESLGGEKVAVHYLDESPHINLLDAKAFQRNPFFGKPGEVGKSGAPVPFRSQDDFQEYLSNNLHKQGFSALGNAVLGIKNPNYKIPKDRGPKEAAVPYYLKEGLDLKVALRNLPIINVENTKLGPAYRQQVKNDNLVVGQNSPAEFGNAVNTVVEHAMENALGYPRSKNARIDVPHDLVEHILGVDKSVAPLGIDAKSSLENFVVRELIAKGNSKSSGLKVFQQNLANSVAGSGISQPEQDALIQLLHGSNSVFLKARGFVPNLVRQISGVDAVRGGLTHSVGGLREAIGRETTNTGVSLSQVRVNFSKQAGIPPISVTNTRDEGSGGDPAIGFSRVRKAGGNIFLAGSGKEFGRGFVPNFILTPQDQAYVESRIQKKKTEGGLTTPESIEAFRKNLRATVGRQSSNEKIKEQASFINQNTPNITKAEARDNTAFVETAHEAALDANPQLRIGQEAINTGVKQSKQSNVSLTGASSVDHRRILSADEQQKARFGIDQILTRAEGEGRLKSFLSGGRDVQHQIVSKFGENYAEELGINKKQADEIGERSQRVNITRQDRLQRFQQKTQAAAIAIPLIGGAAAQFLPEGQNRRKVEGITSAVGAGLQLAAQGGIPGLVIGAGVAIVGIIKAINDNLKPSFEDLSKKTQELATKKGDEIKSIQNVVQNRASIQTAINSGSKSELRVAQTQYDTSLSEVKDVATRQKLIDAKNPEQQTDILLDIQEQSAKEIAASSARRDAAGFRERNKKSAVYGNVLSRDGFQDVSQQGNEDLKELARTTVNAGKEGDKALPGIRRELHGDNSQIFNAYLNAFRKTEEAFSGSREAVVKYNVQLIGLNNTLNKLSSSKLFNQKVQEAVQNGTFNVQSNRLNKTSDLFKPITSEAAQTNVDFEIGSRQAERTRLRQLQETRSDLTQHFAESSSGLNPKNAFDFHQYVQQQIESPTGGGTFAANDKAVGFANPTGDTASKSLQYLNDIRLKLAQSQIEYQNQTQILRENREFARQSLARERLSSFLGGTSAFDTTNIRVGAQAGADETAFNERERTERQRSLNMRMGFQTNNEAKVARGTYEENTYGILGGARAAQSQIYAERDSINIRKGQGVRSELQAGLIGTLADYPTATNFADLPLDVQRLQNSKRGDLLAANASNLYQNAGNIVQAQVEPLIKGAKFEGDGGDEAKSAVRDALASRNPADIDASIAKIQRYNQTNLGGDDAKAKYGARGSSENASVQSIIAQLENYKNTLSRIPVAANEQTNREFKGDKVQESFKLLNSTIKSENASELIKFQDLINETKLVISGVTNVNDSIKNLGTFFNLQNTEAKAQVKVKEDTEEVGKLKSKQASNITELVTSRAKKIEFKHNYGATAKSFDKEFGEVLPQSKTASGEKLSRVAFNGLAGGKSFDDVSKYLSLQYEQQEANSEGGFKAPDINVIRESLKGISTTRGLLGSDETAAKIAENTGIDGQLKAAGTASEKLAKDLERASNQLTLFNTVLQVNTKLDKNSQDSKNSQTSEQIRQASGEARDTARNNYYSVKSNGAEKYKAGIAFQRADIAYRASAYTPEQQAADAKETPQGVAEQQEKNVDNETNRIKNIQQQIGKNYYNGPIDGKVTDALRADVATYNAATGGNLVLAKGYIPRSQVVAEQKAALKVGYSIAPSEVRTMTARVNGGVKQIVYNTREKVIHNFEGTGEPAIIPPGQELKSYIHGAAGIKPFLTNRNLLKKQDGAKALQSKYGSMFNDLTNRSYLKDDITSLDLNAGRPNRTSDDTNLQTDFAFSLKGNNTENPTDSLTSAMFKSRNANAGPARNANADLPRRAIAVGPIDPRTREQIAAGVGWYAGDARTKPYLSFPPTPKVVPSYASFLPPQIRPDSYNPYVHLGPLVTPKYNASQNTASPNPTPVIAQAQAAASVYPNDRPHVAVYDNPDTITNTDQLGQRTNAYGKPMDDAQPDDAISLAHKGIGAFRPFDEQSISDTFDLDGDEKNPNHGKVDPQIRSFAGRVWSPLLLSENGGQTKDVRAGIRDAAKSSAANGIEAYARQSGGENVETVARLINTLSKTATDADEQSSKDASTPPPDPIHAAAGMNTTNHYHMDGHTFVMQGGSKEIDPDNLHAHIFSKIKEYVQYNGMVAPAAST